MQVAKKLQISQQYISELEKRKHLHGQLLDKFLYALSSDREEWEKFKKAFILASLRRNTHYLLKNPRIVFYVVRTRNAS